ncbi:MAG: hypothetical protein WC198_04370 [Victivallaceae bacterium]
MLNESDFHLNVPLMAAIHCAAHGVKLKTQNSNPMELPIEKF